MNIVLIDKSLAVGFWDAPVGNREVSHAHPSATRCHAFVYQRTFYEDRIRPTPMDRALGMVLLLLEGILAGEPCGDWLPAARVSPAHELPVPKGKSWGGHSFIRTVRERSLYARMATEVKKWDQRRLIFLSGNKCLL
ncbi:hypothetical protein GCK32_005387 [Trichostrongylus colubriformis]|uniref:Uncharacterized protein n=1 Tax=Trichostrongylus colubriformis TaxID=6319 RepID=A0AAN8IUZ2_TRICO